MKKPLLAGLVLCLLLCLAPLVGLADDAGALSEGELDAWVAQVLEDTKDQQPLNAPVGEASLTEDGYAFLYDFATLYFDQPERGEQSVLRGIVLTSESYAAPRGIHLGSDEMDLLTTFGWKNPYLMGDGAFATFYHLNDLPRAAYWSWAQHDEDWKLTAVQCAVHVRLEENQYTDAGLRFELVDGAVSAIRVYGLDRSISLEDVQANLNAVLSVEEAIGGADWMPDGLEEPVEGYHSASEAATFSVEDLTFDGLDYPTLTAEELTARLGAEPESARQLDDAQTHQWLLTDRWQGVSLSRLEREGACRVDSLSVTTDALSGPRGVRVGDKLEDVLRLFRSDGEGRTRNGLYAILYGDGIHAPYGLLERSGDVTAVSYTVLLPTDDGLSNVTLHMAFEEDALCEWMLYTW